MNKKIKYGIIGIIFFIGIIGVIGMYFIAPYGILQPQRMHEDTTPQALGLNSENLSIEVGEGVNIKGYWVKTHQDTAKGIIILVHGVGGCKEHFLDLARNLANEGIESIVCDGRAHGESGGEFCTYGFYEKKDIAKIVDFVKSKSPNLPLGIWGNSLGGAVAIQALAYDERIDFGIIESTFTDLNQIVFDYKKRILKGFGIRFVSDYVLKRAGEIANFPPAEVKPIVAVKNITQPVFIAHGDADKNISYHYGQQLYDNLQSEDKEFVLIKDGEHFGLFDTGGKEYVNKIMQFIDRQLRK